MPLAATLSPLRHRNYRLFFTGQAVSLIGMWMQQTAQGWLVTLLASRLVGPAQATQIASYYLGLLTTVGSLPMLFGALGGGVVADRLPKRAIVLTTQTLQALLALAMAVLILSGTAQVPHLFAFALLGGLISVFDIPARQSFVVELVGKEDLGTAVGLNSSLFNGSRMIGPAAAGLLIGALGGDGSERAIGLCYLLNALSFLAVIAGLALMHGDFSARSSGKEPPLRQLRAALVYLRRDAPVRSLLLLLAGFSLFTVADWVLLPALARFTLGADAKMFGLLTSLKGIGAWAGALLIAATASSGRRVERLLAAVIAAPLFMLAIALCKNYTAACLLMPLSGFATVSFLAGANSLLQTSTPDELRGRMMGVHAFLMMGLNPIGGLWAGWLAARTDAATTIAVGAGLALLCGVAALLRPHSLRRLDAPATPL